jgi:hypothetical protein
MYALPISIPVPDCPHPDVDNFNPDIQYYQNMEKYGRIKTNGDYQILITLNPHLCYTPGLYTFDTNGTQIDHQEIRIGEGENNPSQGLSSHEVLIIHSDYTIYNADTVVDFNETQDEVEDIIRTTIKYIAYRKGKLLRNGKIELSNLNRDTLELTQIKPYIDRDTAAIPPEKRTFHNLAYDSVSIYDFNGNDDQYSIIQNGYINRTVIKSATLDSTDAATLSEMLDQKTSFHPGMTACFSPHLGVIYWHQGKLAAELSICTSCSVLRSSIEIQAQLRKYEDGSIYDADMSRKFLLYLNTLISKYHFSHPYIH